MPLGAPRASGPRGTGVLSAPPSTPRSLPEPSHEYGAILTPAPTGQFLHMDNEACPICLRQFPANFIERHVNSCLDTLSPGPEAKHEASSQHTPSKGGASVFSALGLKADTKPDKSKKASATLTSILLAEKRLKRRQEQLEEQIRKRQREEQSQQTNLEAQSRQTNLEVQNQQTNLKVDPSIQDKPSRPEEPSKPESESHPENQSQPGDLSQSEQLSASQMEAMGQSQDAVPSSPVKNEPAPMSDFDRKRAEVAEINELTRDADLPLAQRLRPTSLDDFHGQEQLVGTGGVLRQLVEARELPLFILWGGPGVGKTTLARIIALMLGYVFRELSGVETNAKHLKEAFERAKNEKSRLGTRTVLFLDEIHRYNKAVQDLLLPVIERGTVCVIGATTENPLFTLNNALLSRMHTFVMEPLLTDAVVRILNRGLLLVNKTRKHVHGLYLIALQREAVHFIAELSKGDSRVALNILECINACFSSRKFDASQPQLPGPTQGSPPLSQPALALPHETTDTSGPAKTQPNPSGKPAGVVKVSLDTVKNLFKAKNFHHAYDRKGDNHYDTISAFHKAVRGSSADAAIFYLAKMLAGGEDPLFVARRMVVIASEDVGLRDLSCLPFAVAAMEAVQLIGMPEAEIVLAHCAVKLARAKKSTKLYRALRAAQTLMRLRPEVASLLVPLHLRNAPTALMQELGYSESYKYNPDYSHGLVEQEYFPPEAAGLSFVDSVHLGRQVDEAVDPAEYAAADKEDLDYRLFKKWRATQPDYSASWPASYDENLSKDDQPQYFDGSERDNYLDDETCVDNFNKSYDEFHV